MTPGARRVLQDMVDDEDKDLVVSGRLAYCGNRATTRRVVNELLTCMAISVSWKETETSIYYCINETGRALLRRPELEAEIAASMGKGPISIIDDRVVFI